METERFNALLKNFNSDASASREIYEYLFPKIRLHISRNFPEVAAEDIAQEFFVKLVNMNLSRQPYIRYPVSWVYRITDNLAKSELRSAYLKHEIACDTIKVESSANEYELLMQREEVKSFMSQLDETDKEIFYLCYWEGYSLKEVSFITGAKLPFVKQRHSRAIKKLKLFSESCIQNDYSLRLYIKSEVKK